jgi:hypothetical protein
MNWTNSTGAFSTEGKYGAYGSGMWIAVGDDDDGFGNQMNSIKRSTDNGTSWSNVTLGGQFPSYGQGVAYNGSDKWVAVGNDGDSNGKTIKYSSDGLNWLYAANGKFEFNGRKVVFADNIWIAVGRDVDGNAIRYSTAGINWQNSKKSGLDSAFTVAYGSGWWVVGGMTSGNTMKISQNGLLWFSPIINLFQTACYGVAFDGVKRWVAVGSDATSTIKYVDV